jgi:hypothetical protein
MKLIKNLLAWVIIALCVISSTFAASWLIMSWTTASGSTTTWITKTRDKGFVAPVKPQRTIVVPDVIMKSLIRNTTSYAQLKHQIRLYLIKQLMEQWYTGFVTRPYANTWSDGAITSSRYGEYQLNQEIVATDDLDLYLDKQLRKTYMRLPQTLEERKLLPWSGLVINESEYNLFKPMYLFTSIWDLEALGYEMVSHRVRTNKDPAYRRHNILTAFKFLWHVIVLNSGDSVWVLRDIGYDPIAQRNYMEGKAIVDDEEIPNYGWGICGSSTAIYQGTVTNAALAIKSRNHSRRYANLYNATINGQRIDTPWLDSTVYSSNSDLLIRNTRAYPVIIVANYDGSYGWEEQVFTFAKPSDRGRTTYLDHSSYKSKDKQNKAITVNCYRRDINGKVSNRCYKKVQ